jgi:serine/threonine protein phosphatase PrpC
VGVPAVLPRFDFRVDFAVAEDIGRERERYEDAAMLAPDLAVFAVADGMGGHQAGEVAARLAVHAVREALGERRAQRAVENYAQRADLPSRREVFQRLRQAVERANTLVRADAAENSAHSGMGATLDVVWLARDHAFVAHAGDGRVYLARARAVLQVTEDHTPDAAHRGEGGPAGRAYRHGGGLTNAIGLRDVVAVDTAFLDVARGDRLLLCSDGLYTEFTGETELAELLRTGTAEQAARTLVTRAARGGRDNATAIVIDIGERFVGRSNQDRGFDPADLERARESPLLAGLPEPLALSALSAAVEVELPAGEFVPRVVASDLVSYIVLEGVARYAASGRRVGPGALIYPESLLGVTGQGEGPVLEETCRLLRVRAEDFAEVCRDPRLASELYRRVAQHFARMGVRS